MKLELMYETIPPVGKFVAIYSDGGGASLFIMNKDGSITNADGETASDEALDDYLYWIQLPDDLMYRFEKD